ncbi:MAG: hypothetical protein FJ034_05295 [Chloroflexi bacterium]|nr:hypothetical protein [Chloroflexota bacterium]
MAERVILADCCEDWIIEWGAFYPQGAAFACPECATAWTKTQAQGYRRADGREFKRAARGSGGASFPYLAAADGHEPNVDRCCAKILLGHGERMADGEFTCPVCSTRWRKRTERLHGMRVPVFAKDGLAEALAIQPGRWRPFLVSLLEWSPPRE